MSNKLAALRRIAHSLKQINDMECISIQKLPAITVASHRRILKRREDLTPLFQEVINPEIHRIGCRRTLPIYGFSIEHEQEYKTEDIDTEYCLQVDQAQADTPIIKFRQLPEVARAVCLKHTGDYSTIDESFAEVAGYIHSHGLEIDGEYRIQFVEDIHNQRNPDKWITIIQVPVRDKPS
jgi:effector-binding domain-containing protein